MTERSESTTAQGTTPDAEGDGGEERPTVSPPFDTDEFARRSMSGLVADAYDSITDGSLKPPPPRSEAPTLNDPSEIERALAEARERESSKNLTDEVLSPLSMVNSIALSIPPEAPTRPSLMPVLLTEELSSFDKAWADDDGGEETPRPEAELGVSGSAPTKPPVGPPAKEAPGAETKPPPAHQTPALLLGNTEDVFADIAAEDAAFGAAPHADIPPAVPSLPEGLHAPEPIVSAPPQARGPSANPAAGRSIPTPRDEGEEMLDRLSLGNFSGALELAEAILRREPTHENARRVETESREKLLLMYTARIGSLERVPQVAIPAEQLRWLSLDHRAGFVLSLIDGFSNVEMILDISGMPHFDALRILVELQEQKIIAVR